MVELADLHVFGAGLVAAAAVVLVAAFLHRWRGAGAEGDPNGDYRGRDCLTYADLVNPQVRADHLSFNAHLHERFKGQTFVPVVGEKGCFVAFTHAVCKDVMNDHATFSSNPFPDGRLVALNTMAKADHSRVLRYVHSHYTQGEVVRLEGKMRGILQRCTDDLEADGAEGAEVVVWARRIHMACTLARLGLDVLPAADATKVTKAAWKHVDGIIALNNAMVALVAPLGGVGRRYSELPASQALFVLMGLLRSLLPTMLMAWRLGLRCTWEIIRPDVTVLFPPRRPRMGLWWHPELLPLVPRYFMQLNDLLEGQQVDEGPVPGIRQGLRMGDLSRAEALTLLVQLMVNMTSANALASLVFRLGTEGAAARELAADPERLAPVFVQEVLRLDAPLQRNPRRVERPPAGKWADAPMKEGDEVLLFLGAANMDPAVFEAPSEFRLDRAASDKDRAGPLSFGSGMHYCLGSSMVKLEMQLALECLLQRFASVAVLGDYQRLVDVDVGNWGFQSLRVRLQRK